MTRAYARSKLGPHRGLVRQSESFVSDGHFSGSTALSSRAVRLLRHGTVGEGAGVRGAEDVERGSGRDIDCLGGGGDVDGSHAKGRWASR